MLNAAEADIIEVRRVQWLVRRSISLSANRIATCGLHGLSLQRQGLSLQLNRLAALRDDRAPAWAEGYGRRAE